MYDWQRQLLESAVLVTEGLVLVFVWNLLKAECKPEGISALMIVVGAFVCGNTLVFCVAYRYELLTINRLIQLIAASIPAVIMAWILYYRMIAVFEFFIRRRKV